MLGPISDKARDLIFKFEDLDQPGEWPGGESGVTIGIGYDLGQASRSKISADWSSLVDPDMIMVKAAASERLRAARKSAPHGIAARVLPKS